MKANRQAIQSEAQYRACSGRMQGIGATPGEALSELMKLVGASPETPIVIWPFNRGDAYFTDAQQRRLEDLKAKLHQLTVTERKELEELVEASFDASVLRSKAVLGNGQ